MYQGSAATAKAAITAGWRRSVKRLRPAHNNGVARASGTSPFASTASPSKKAAGINPRGSPFASQGRHRNIGHGRMAIADPSRGRTEHGRGEQCWAAAPFTAQPNEVEGQKAGADAGDRQARCEVIAESQPE